MAAKPKGLISMELSGPFFTADPRKTIRQNIRAYQDRVAEVGEAEVRARLLPGRSADAIRDRIRGRTSSTGGRRWATYAVVSLRTGDLDAAGARRASAQMSGRRIATTADGRNIGTTRGADGRRAVSGAVRAMRAVIKNTDILKGLT